MSRNKYKYFKNVSQVTYKVENQPIVEEVDCSINVEDTGYLNMGLYEDNSGNSSLYNNYYDDSLYNDNESSEYKNTDLYIKYNIESEMLVTAKEARTTTDKKTKFIVSKDEAYLEDNKKHFKKSKSIITEADNIYKLSSKMRKSGFAQQYLSKPIERIGFIEVSDNATDIMSSKQLEKKTKQNKILGMLEDNKPILKTKPFNTRKIGYLPVELSEMQHHMCKDNYLNADIKTQQFVEVVEKRDKKWIAAILLIMFIIIAVLKTVDTEGWKFNLSNLTIFKTEEQTNTEEDNLQLSFNVSPTLITTEETGRYRLNINLYSQQTESEITYKATLYTSNNTEIWSRSNILTGETIEEIEVTLPQTASNQETIPCELKATIYKEGRYIGEIKSSLTINIEE